MLEVKVLMERSVCSHYFLPSPDHHPFPQTTPLYLLSSLKLGLLTWRDRDSPCPEFGGDETGRLVPSRSTESVESLRLQYNRSILGRPRDSSSSSSSTMRSGFRVRVRVKGPEWNEPCVYSIREEEEEEEGESSNGRD